MQNQRLDCLNITGVIRTLTLTALKAILNLPLFHLEAKKKTAGDSYKHDTINA